MAADDKRRSMRCCGNMKSSISMRRGAPQPASEDGEVEGGVEGRSAEDASVGTDQKRREDDVRGRAEGRGASAAPIYF